MKKLMTSLMMAPVVMVLMAGLVFGAKLGIPNVIPVDDNTRNYGSVNPEKTYTVNGASNAIGNGAGVDMGFTTSSYTCHVTRTGTASLTVNLQGSITSVSAGFANLTAPHTVTTDTDTFMFHVRDKGVRYIRGQCLTGCDVTNTMAMNCTAGGN